ncbi:hypothetical protein AUJ66_06735 [Candidatus Desantisbacteria bacterium CG1_02_38_46]|uniref:Polymerase nucleotidyl transferase domain-containing protein n=3 Tax=unclassified Candidatus Desantisiibacteriota TaxID=3106372 RepID=A0A2H9PBV1_9BACT|nr:MAG: hypothetical protein AUJ66_06735 [Candidatus Desantisbacteria bacterium CG1_02_38_46]PIU50720.1 MAG: hypothetical protein COS91_08175 [Candidatus Desantisbacteria bacterium CG07_land_8_20_14_0_80_39_15]PIZ16416.1 MAG: hypothetical protein COY51_02805 [Candidatus Desantisbacteria bacterium CG_4_10_14_0_8_um_filter_39_17]
MEKIIDCLRKKDKESLNEFKEKVRKKFPEASFILFGSKVRGKDTIFSDIDILVILDREITTSIEEEVFEVGFEVGLKYEVVFGIVVEERKFWDFSLYKEMPFYQNIDREGVKI